MFTPHPVRRRAGIQTGFTLIELLVVIAIIAILTAIIFPVFATVRENARQQSSMANMHQIQTGLAQFKLDQGTYPPVLFGYAISGQSMTTALQYAETQYIAAQYFPGIYPEYVNNPETFIDPNNALKDPTQTVGVAVNALTVASGGQSATIQQVDAGSTYNTNFYAIDAYDVSPQIINTNGNYSLSQPTSGSSLPYGTYVARYQTSWTGIGNSSQGTDYADQYPLNYVRQLRWTNPPATTYVTSTTYHVPYDNRVLVLWETGNAQSIDASRFLGGSAGTPSAGSDASSAYGANFWQVSPTSASNPGP